jgi:hypothetical protein
MADNPIRWRPPTFSDAELRHIFARAIEMDRRLAERVSEDDVRVIARELGVSSLAISEALHEQLAASGSETPPDRKWLQGFAAVAQGALIGVVPGVAAGLMRIYQWPGEVSWLILAAAYGSALAFALRVDGSDKQRMFQLRNFGLWAGFAASWSWVMGPPEDLLLMIWVWATTAAAGGGLVVWLRETMAKHKGFARRLGAGLQRVARHMRGETNEQNRPHFRERASL